MDAIEISFDPARIDFAATSAQIRTSYWGAGRSDALHRVAFANSLCVAAYRQDRQVGFARVVSDRACFAYLCDVIVWPEARGQGIGKRLIQALLDHPSLAHVASWMLRTSDAQSLYTQFGFQVTEDGMFMRLVRPPI